LRRITKAIIGHTEGRVPVRYPAGGIAGEAGAARRSSQ
jgi:hypothetical protein